MRINRLATAALIAVSFVGMNFQAANASDISNIVKGLINRNGVNQGTYVDPSYYGNPGYVNPGYVNPSYAYPGTYPLQTTYPQVYPNPGYAPVYQAPVNGKTAGNQAQIENNLNTGLANYQQQISSGVATGTISPAAANGLQAELNRISNMRAQFAAGGYTDAEVQQMLSTFNSFNSMLSGAQVTVNRGWYGY